MIVRMNRTICQKYWILSVLFCGCILSAAAWLVSLPPLPCTVQQRYYYKRTYSLVRLEAKKPSKNENEKDQKSDSESGGFFGMFSGAKQETGKQDKKVTPKSKNEKDQKSDSNSGSFFSSFGREKTPSKNENGKDQKNDSNSKGFFGSLSRERKDPKKQEVPKDEGSSGVIRSIQKRLKTKKEASTEESEAASKKETPKGFDFSALSSALEDVEAGIKQSRDGLPSRQAEKPPITREKKVDDLGKKIASEGDSKVKAQLLADQRRIERQLQKKKQKLETETKAEGESSKWTNPLSVAQKYVSDRFEKKALKEEWIVVAPKTRIMPGEIVPISIAGLDLLLIASKDGSTLHCIENSCPHLGTPLETGMLDRRPIEGGENSGDGEIELQETDIAKLLTQDGCEDCIVCPLHKTAFALESGEVRGEWCPYPPVIGKVMGAVKDKDSLPVFDVRTKGKNIEVRLNTPIQADKT